MMLGNLVSEEVFLERTDEEDNAATAIHVKLLIEDCKKLLIPDPEIILGSWGVIDADPMYVLNIHYNILLYLYIYDLGFNQKFLIFILVPVTQRKRKWILF